MIQLINQARAASGAPALAEAKGLTSMAIWWSSQESGGVNNYTLAHNPNAWTMLTSYGASNRSSWGENVAWSSSTASTAQQIFTAYMNSPGHKANILAKNYRFVGMGTVGGAHGLFNTTEFTDAVQSGQAVTPPAVQAAPPVVKPKPVVKPQPPVRKPAITLWAPAALATGDFVRDAGTGIYYQMVGGAPVAFVSWAPFGGGKAVKMISHSVFLHLARYPTDGTFIRSAGSRNVFVIAGGAPVFVSAPYTLPRGARVTDVDPAVVVKAGLPGVWSHLRAVPADGTFVRTAADGAVYRIAGGAPIWVDSFTPFGGPKHWVDIDPNTVAHGGMPGAWSHLKLRPVDNTYLKGIDSPKVYRVRAGHPEWVRSWASVGGVKAFTTVSTGSILRAGTGGRFNHLL